MLELVCHFRKAALSACNFQSTFTMTIQMSIVLNIGHVSLPQRHPSNYSPV